MTTTREEKKQLRNMGDVHWKTALDKGYYHDQLLYNKSIDRRILTEDVLVECSNTRYKPQGIIFNVILDRKFFIEKAIRHIVHCFSSEKELMEFMKECWVQHEKTKQLSKLISVRRGDLNSLNDVKKKEALSLLGWAASELEYDLVPRKEVSKVN